MVLAAYQIKNFLHYVVTLGLLWSILIIVITMATVLTA